jgi:hypothetical protein
MALLHLFGQSFLIFGGKSLKRGFNPEKLRTGQHFVEIHTFRLDILGGNSAFILVEIVETMLMRICLTSVYLWPVLLQVEVDE